MNYRVGFFGPGAEFHWNTVDMDGDEIVLMLAGLGFVPINGEEVHIQVHGPGTLGTRHIIWDGSTIRTEMQR